VGIGSPIKGQGQGQGQTLICDFIISLSIEIEDLTLTLQPHSGKSFSDQSRVSLAMENSDNLILSGSIT
jgi:hypothetical protein